MTLSEIARRIEEIRHGTLPPSFEYCGPLVPTDIARHMLIGAMVMAIPQCIPARLNDSDGGLWSLSKVSPGLFRDKDHGNDPLRSLLAAFERVYAKEDK